MSPQEYQALIARLQQLKNQAEMALAAAVMLERNVRELTTQLHQVVSVAKGDKW